MWVFDMTINPNSTNFKIYDVITSLINYLITSQLNYVVKKHQKNSLPLNF